MKLIVVVALLVISLSGCTFFGYQPADAHLSQSNSSLGLNHD
ncbi:MAG: hypothetical protein V4660_13130 [Pseudomonadota bacterium]